MRRLVMSAALLLTLSLAGCVWQATSVYTAESSAQLHSGVLAVSESAAAGDPESALARLNELDAALLDQLDRGTVDQARFDRIFAAIQLVRADLELAIAQAAEQPGNSDKPSKPDKPDKPGKPGRGD